MLCTFKVNANEVKNQDTDWEKVFSMDISDKDLLSRMYKEHIN